MCLFEQKKPSRTGLFGFQQINHQSVSPSEKIPFAKNIFQLVSFTMVLKGEEKGIFFSNVPLRALG